MSEFKEHPNRDYSRFDALSTEVLNDLLRQDSQAPDGEETDMDAILYIMEVVAKREEEHPTIEFTDVDTAWKSFNENYRPFDSDERSLYDFDEEPEEKSLPDAEPIPFTSSKPPTKGGKHGFFRTICVAAAIIIVIFAGSLTAYAFGYDLWGAIAAWTKDTFGFESATAEQSQPANQVPEQLKELEVVMSEHGLPNTILPSYIPDGYVSAGVQCNVLTNITDISCILENGEGSISLFYRVYLSENFSLQYEKNDYNPEVYESNGMTFYIMTNMDTYLAAWTVDNIECSISGVASYDEIIKIIDSIKGG